jgi:hypothetical protein
MFAPCNLFSSCVPSLFSSITLGDGSSIPIHYVGQAQIPSPLKPLLLCDVFVAPFLIKNLIYVRQFTRDNLVSIEFDLSVKDYRTKDEIAHFNSFGKLYLLHGMPAAPPPTSMIASIDLWQKMSWISS